MEIIEETKKKQGIKKKEGDRDKKEKNRQRKSET